MAMKFDDRSEMFVKIKIICTVNFTRSRTQILKLVLSPVGAKYFFLYCIKEEIDEELKYLLKELLMLFVTTS
jgi:hypothetical protein